MRMLDNDAGRALERVTIYLTPAEAEELRKYLEAFERGDLEHHVHMMDGEYRMEINIAVYTRENLKDFDEQSRRLLEQTAE